jgi:uncharacterized protein
MLIAAMCFDKPDHVDLRQKTRTEHLDWIKGGVVDVKYGGPLLADDGETSIGSLLIAEAENLAVARAFFAEDPYNKAGLFERVVVMPTRQVLPGA